MGGLDGGDEDTWRLEGFWMAHHYLLNMRLLWLLCSLCCCVYTQCVCIYIFIGGDNHVEDSVFAVEG